MRHQMVALRTPPESRRGSALTCQRLKREAGAAHHAPERLLVRHRQRRLTGNIMLMTVHAAAAAALVHLGYRPDFRRRRVPSPTGTSGASIFATGGVCLSTSLP